MRIIFDWKLLSTILRVFSILGSQGLLRLCLIPCPWVSALYFRQMKRCFFLLCCRCRITCHLFVHSFVSFTDSIFNSLEISQYPFNPFMLHFQSSLNLYLHVHNQILYLLIELIIWFFDQWDYHIYNLRPFLSLKSLLILVRFAMLECWVKHG